MLGAQGADVLDGGAKADVMRGNSGPDTVSYATRSKTVFVTLSSGDPNDGEPDEKDHITSTEGAIGGSGDDEITGYSALNVLVGNGGKDKIAGRAGNDMLLGGSGDDDIKGDCRSCPSSTPPATKPGTTASRGTAARTSSSATPARTR